ncbi:MAG: hypothetical protein HYZ57_07385 [Acidobacteria bacterium]|nr:hypothetical protein [Acidobacteriota bacterium]
MKLALTLVCLATCTVIYADTKMTMRYTVAGQSDDQTTLQKGNRSRFEGAGGLIMIQQCDTKQMVVVNTQARTYSTSPLGGPQLPAQMAPPPSGAPAAPVAAAPKGSILYKITSQDTGETRTAFGKVARHIKTVIITEPGPAACERKKQRIETDGWYLEGIEQPGCSVAVVDERPNAAGCSDEVKTEMTGKAAVGLPVAYSMKITEEAEGTAPPTSTEIRMEMRELSLETLDAALFEPPPGFTAAGDLKQFAQQLSGVPTPASVPPKAPGTTRVGVAAIGNRSGRSFATDTFRDKILTQLAGEKLEAYPAEGKLAMDRVRAAKQLDCDVVLEVDLVEIKKASAGRFGSLVKAAGAIGSMGSAPKENWEAKLDYRLVSTATGSTVANGSSTGKTGGDLNLRSAMSIASTAMRFMPAGMMLRAMYGNPALMNMMLQNPAFNGTGGMGGGGGMPGMSLDPSASAHMGMARQLQLATGGGEPELPRATDDESAAINNAVAAAMKSLGSHWKKR